MSRPLDLDRLRLLIKESCEGLGRAVEPELILQSILKDLYDGVPMEEVRKGAILSARALIEKDPAYSYVTARLLLNSIRYEVLGGGAHPGGHAGPLRRSISRDSSSRASPPGCSTRGCARSTCTRWARRWTRTATSSSATLACRRSTTATSSTWTVVASSCPRPSSCASRWAWPSTKWSAKTRAIEFYNVLSSFDFMSSTPTLFNSGTHRSQLSSCYLTTVSDDLEGIYDAIKENALLSKFAGGLGNDWTPVRALGSHIKGTNGKSQGVVPFLKVVNDTAVAVNQGGKRKGAVCSYLETWHLDIEEFLELRKNTGDDRRRTHDMNTANWVPDLFMKRVMENGEWTLFSPADTPRSARQVRQGLREGLRRVRAQGGAAAS